MDTEPMAYVARMSCGCLMGMTVDNGEHVRDKTRDIGTWMRAGAQIERMAVVAARLVAWKCAEHESAALKSAVPRPRRPRREQPALL